MTFIQSLSAVLNRLQLAVGKSLCICFEWRPFARSIPTSVYRDTGAFACHDNNAARNRVASKFSALCIGENLVYSNVGCFDSLTRGGKDNLISKWIRIHNFSSYFGSVCQIAVDFLGSGRSGHGIKRTTITATDLIWQS